MPNNRSAASEVDIEQLEASFPASSGEVFDNAFHQALAAGLSVLVADGSAIYEVFPGGNQSFVKPITPPSPVQPGSKFTLPQ